MTRLLPLLICLLSASLPTTNASSSPTTSSSNNKPTLKVHLVAHTHDDVGWLKTKNQYFYGANSTIQHASVSIILTSLIPALEFNPSRKFIYAEMAFFSMWWDLQTPSMKTRVRALVSNGQLSFVNGGWCMHDEGATHYMGQIDQTTLGHSFLKREFNYTPTVAWQIDPFGHSKTHAAFSKMSGMDALFIGRIDTQDLADRKERRTIEGIWRTSESLNSSRSDIFWSLTGSYDGNYSPLPGFNFDSFSQDEYIVDDPASSLNNVDNRMIDFANAIYNQGNDQTGNNVMLTMGSDFQFENAMSNFLQYERAKRGSEANKLRN